MKCKVWSTYFSGRTPQLLWEGEISHMPREGDNIAIDTDGPTMLVVSVFWVLEQNEVVVRVQ